jgi:heat shock protein HslJ
MKWPGALVVVLALGACGSGEGPDVAGTWVLVSGTVDGEAIVPFEGHEINLSVEVAGTEAQLSGSSGCNQYFGGWTIEPDGSVTGSPVGGTLMACMEPEGLMDAEIRYLDALGRTDRADVDGASLVLTGPDAELVFEARG